MSNVADIKDREPNLSTIEYLETLLEQAKSGRLRSLVYLCQWDDDCVSHGWSLDDRNTRRRMLAEIAMLQHDYIVNLGFSEGDTVLSRAFEIE